MIRKITLISFVSIQNMQVRVRGHCIICRSLTECKLWAPLFTSTGLLFLFFFWRLTFAFDVNLEVSIEPIST